MTRIVAGSHRGRPLLVPAGSVTRPTAGRVREAMFSSLQSLVDLEGARVLDLYAGSGALGLEAVSRGARTTVLVDSDERAVATLRSNVARLGLDAVVVDAPVQRFLDEGPDRHGGPFDLVLLDPPYDLDLDPVLARLGPWLAEEAVVVVERASGAPEPAWPPDVVPERSRRYGAATLWYGSRS